MPDFGAIIERFVSYHRLDSAAVWPLVMSFIGFVVVFGSLAAGVWLLSLPLRRRGRGRILVHLIEVSNQTGAPIERVINAAARGGEPFSRHFRPLAAALGRGQRLDEALHNSPSLAGTALTAMFRVGFEIGDVRKVLPACRRMLNDGISQGRAGLNYTVFMSPLTLPVGVVLILVMLTTVVLPKLRQIFIEMESAEAPAFAFFNDHVPQLTLLAVGASTLIFVAGVLHLGGRWLATNIPLLDHLFHRLPWHRRRMQRDFSAMLALLLDGGVPEKIALGLAGDCAGNRVFRRRVAKAAGQLEAGAPLAEALRWLDGSGEFQWRFANAAHSASGFGALLAGWQEALDAKAFQQEQAAAQLLTTGFVMVQGVVVGVVTVGIFSALVAIIEGGVLW